MENNLSNLKNRILGGSKEYDLIDIYHNLMKTYGYITFSDFITMDAELVDELVSRINKDREAEKEANK